MKEKKWTKRIFPLLLAAALLLGIFPASAAQQEEAVPVSAILSEETSLREESSKRFLCEDGTFIVAAYGTPVHYKQEAAQDDATWQEIDNRLVLNSRALSASGKATYTPMASAMLASLPQDFSDGQQVTVSNKGYTFGFGVSAEKQAVSLESVATLVDVEELPSAAALWREDSQEKKGPQTQAEKIQEQNAEKMAVDNLSSAVVYEGVFSDTTLEYIVTPEGLKENFVVASPQAEYIYRFNVSMDGLIAKSQEDGSILLVEASNPEEAVFILEAPYMYDANGEESRDVQMTLENGVLTISADSVWLNDEKRAFPAVIDPTISYIYNLNTSTYIKDSYVSSLFPNSTNTNASKLFTGKTLLGERNRTYVKLSWPSIPSNAKVTYAQFELYKASSNNQVIQVRDLYPSSVGTLYPASVSWNYQPISTAANSASSLPLLDSQATASGSSVYRFNITAALQRWHANGRNNGLVFTVTNENNVGQTDFYSTRHGTTAYRPVFWYGYSLLQNDFIDNLFNTISNGTVTSQLSSSTYYQPLSKYAMYLSYTAYNPLPPGIITPSIPGGMMNKMYVQIQNELHEKGFENVKQYNYTNTFFNFNINTAGHTIGHRKIAGMNGDRSLIVVAVRGTAPDIEWVTNILSVTDSDLAGFKRAAIDVRTNLRNYINDPQIKPKLVNPIILVTGHSLGGSVANLVAEHLNTCNSSACCPERGMAKTYAYTFASPTVTNIAAASDPNVNIFNILNSCNKPATLISLFTPCCDIVTHVPGYFMVGSGWRRFGKEVHITMPSYPALPANPGWLDKVAGNHQMPTYYRFLELLPATTTWANLVSMSN